MNSAPDCSPSGDGDLATADVSPHRSSDWRDGLLEAIQQRDAPRAIQLAQRCVHRYGMQTLESLLEGVQGEEDNPERARDWLLPLLHQPSAALQPSSDPPPPSPRRLEGAPMGLDEAFAPLEIAFPPLTGRVGETLPDDYPTRPSPSPHPPSAPSAPSAIGPVVEEAGASSFPLQNIHGEGMPPHGGPLFDPDLGEREAAPIPTFDLGAASAGPPPSPSKPRKVSGREPLSPPPISPALKPWLVWLPGAVQAMDHQ